MNDGIKQQQLNALSIGKEFLKNNDLKNPHLTHSIWTIINSPNNKTPITDSNAIKYKDNWSNDIVSHLQRILVNYQLYQTKIGNPPIVFKIIKDIFDNITENHLTLLDVGCTSGYYFEVINSIFPGKYTYTGCDYNKEALKLAKQYYPFPTFDYQDVTNLKYKDNQFDIIFLSGVIEHVPNFKSAINELCRVSNKYIILHRIMLTDDETFCTKGTQYFVEVIRYTYNKKQLLSLFKNNGFHLIWDTPQFYDGNCKSFILKRILV